VTTWTTGRRGGRRERGAALLVVMVAVAFLTALAVDLAYQSRVTLQIAANGRDALRAEALARGAVALSRLVLHFQSQVDDAAAQGQQAAAAAGQQVAAPRPQIWKAIPVSSGLVASLFGGAPAEVAPAEGRGPEAAPARRFGDFDGAFVARIEDEDRKVSVQLDALDTSGLQGARLQAFLELTAERKWDFLFDTEDAQGQRTSRTDLAVHLKDWVDPNQVQSSVTGLANRPFEDGFGDENFLYDRDDDRYKAKNARFDSLDELFMVTGVSDAFMAAFGDRLTVYMGTDSQMNVNADTRDELVRNARIMADPPLQPIFSDPSFPERLEKAVQEIRLGGLLSLTPADFAGLLEAMGVSVHPDYTQARSGVRGAFTDRSQVFRVRGTGSAGRVEKTIEAVVTFDPAQARGEARQLGRVLHWREE
jgi:general secretion pathway protein K